MATRLLVPTDLGTLPFWGDFQTSANVTKDAGNNVTALAARSGSQVPSVTGVSGKYPIFMAAALNGFDCAQFAAGGLNSATLATPLAANTVVNWFFVGSLATGAAGYSRSGAFVPTAGSSSDAYSGISLLSTGTAAGQISGYNLFNGVKTTATTANAVHVYAAYTLDGTTSNISVDASAIVNSTSQKPYFTSTLAGFNFGWSGGDGPWTGLIGEAFCVLGVMTQEQVNQAIGYLAWRWNNQGALPSGFEYKTAAPTVNTGGSGSTGSAALLGSASLAALAVSSHFASGAVTGTSTVAATGKGRPISTGTGAIAGSAATNIAARAGNTARAIITGNAQTTSATRVADTARGATTGSATVSAAASGQRSAIGRGAVTGSAATGSATRVADTARGAVAGGGAVLSTSRAADTGRGSVTGNARVVATTTGRRTAVGSGAVTGSALLFGAARVADVARGAVTGKAAGSGTARLGNTIRGAATGTANLFATAVTAKTSHAGNGAVTGSATTLAAVRTGRSSRAALLGSASMIATAGRRTTLSVPAARTVTTNVTGSRTVTTVARSRIAVQGGLHA